MKGNAFISAGRMGKKITASGGVFVTSTKPSFLCFFG